VARQAQSAELVADRTKCIEDLGPVDFAKVAKQDANGSPKPIDGSFRGPASVLGRRPSLIGFMSGESGSSTKSWVRQAVAIADHVAPLRKRTACLAASQDCNAAKALSGWVAMWAAKGGLPLGCQLARPVPAPRVALTFPVRCRRISSL
jgi:hypothetical protein